LHEQPSLGRTILEKFEDEASNVDVVFILLTPDDATYDSTVPNSMKRRARQNVIFELGYFLSKLERKRGRVLLLYKGELELPSDIAGLIYIDITNGIESAGERIRKELIDLLPY
jgi:predicted nucleotide-binding protein